METEEYQSDNAYSREHDLADKVKSWWQNPIMIAVISFMLGLLLPLFFIVIPMHRQLSRRDGLVAEMQEFNQKEQERLARRDDLTEAQLRRWVSINEEANRRYQEIFDRLRKVEARHSNYALYVTALIVFLTSVIIGFYIWLNHKENIKDSTTLENFETVIEQRLASLSVKGELADNNMNQKAIEEGDACKDEAGENDV